jgi:hypothetical protein
MLAATMLGEEGAGSEVKVLATDVQPVLARLQRGVKESQHPAHACTLLTEGQTSLMQGLRRKISTGMPLTVSMPSSGKARSS